MSDFAAIRDFDYAGFARRLNEAMFPEKATGLAERTGVPQPTISKYLRAEGVAPRLDIASVLARAVNVTLEWLVWGIGDNPDGDSGFVKVARYDVRLAAGTGSWNEGRRKLDDIPFTREFLIKKLNRSSAIGLSVLEGSGDSMIPTIMDGALMLVDELDTRITDGVFAFLQDEDARVKRLKKLTDGLSLISDNTIYPPENLSLDDRSRLQIIGRVRWVGQLLY